MSVAVYECGCVRVWLCTSVAVYECGCVRVCARVRMHLCLCVSSALTRFGEKVGGGACVHPKPTHSFRVLGLLHGARKPWEGPLATGGQWERTVGGGRGWVGVGGGHMGIRYHGVPTHTHHTPPHTPHTPDDQPSHTTHTPVVRGLATGKRVLQSSEVCVIQFPLGAIAH